MNKKPDIVSLKWVIGLINTQADAAEAALVEYGNDTAQKQALLRCMWSVHQITSTLRALGMRKAEMLTLEMERSLNFLSPMRRWTYGPCSTGTWLSSRHWPGSKARPWTDRRPKLIVELPARPSGHLRSARELGSPAAAAP